MRCVAKYFAFLAVCTALFISCKHKVETKKTDVVADPAEMNNKVKENIDNILSAADDDQRMPDSTKLHYYSFLKYYYDKVDAPLWSSREMASPVSQQLYRYIENGALQGLFPEDYHFEKLREIVSALQKDSLKRKDAVLWANADILFTDALAHMLKDLRQGRLIADSLSLKRDTAAFRKFFALNIDKIRAGENIDSVLSKVQPRHEGYLDLKKGIKNFTDSMDLKQYTYLPYPYKDTLSFLKLFRKRMSEEGINIPADADSTTFSNLVKRYQKNAGITVDGKVGGGMVKKLNLTDRQRFKTLAITMDKYKMLPEKMPEKYIWVNLPGYYLRVLQDDTLVFESKVICGKPGTPTPLITSAISDIVIYPTWTVPTSIISKEILPGLKRNPNYLDRKGLYLLNKDGERIDAASVNWAKYSKGIPFKIQQGSGDDNALGVIKFNFNNPFSVYLHDTNQRYLFKNGVRCLSHGCVRVQEWQKLAAFIVNEDSLIAKRGDTLKYNRDSIDNWIAHKERHYIDLKSRIPLFIRYFGCEAVKGTIRFYDDIYGDDRALAQKYFPGK